MVIPWTGKHVSLIRKNIHSSFCLLKKTVCVYTYVRATNTLLVSLCLLPHYDQIWTESWKNATSILPNNSFFLFIFTKQITRLRVWLIEGTKKTFSENTTRLKNSSKTDSNSFCTSYLSIPVPNTIETKHAYPIFAHYECPMRKIPQPNRFSTKKRRGRKLKNKIETKKKKKQLHKE